MPKIYGDEDSSDSKGLELADGAKVGKKTTGSARDGSGPSTSGRGVGGSGSRKRSREDNGDDDDPNKRRKTGDEGEPPRPMVARKEPRKSGTVYPPDQQKAASPLHLSPERKNLAGPSRVGLDSGAEEEDT